MKKILLSGCRPTGGLHLGHYLGTFKTVSDIQNAYTPFFVVSNFHMLTTKNSKIDIQQMSQNIYSIVAECIALGISPNTTTYYLQSEIKDLPKLYTFIQNYAYIDRLLKNDSNQHMQKASNSKYSLGLLGYAVLELADMIGMGAEAVVIGSDNLNHLEATNSIGLGLSSLGVKYKEIDPIVTLSTNLIGLDAANKMSKSLGNSINLSDNADQIREKLNKVEEANRGIILSSFRNALKEFYDVERIVNYSNLIEFIVDIIEPISSERNKILDDKQYIFNILKEGNDIVNQIFSNNVNSILTDTGFLFK